MAPPTSPRRWAAPHEMAMETRAVFAHYIGGERAEVRVGDYALLVDERVNLERPGATLCPVELVAAALAA